MNKESRPYRLSIRVSNNEMDRLTQIKKELGYKEHTALFLVRLALDIYDNEVDDQWIAKHNKRQD
jgi:predicted DNA-binding protein